MSKTDREVFLITGARKGIGRALAEHFLRKGSLVIGCSRGESEWASDGYLHCQVDVGVESQVRDLILEVKSRFGRLDVIINNAGIAAMNHVLLTPADGAEKIMQTNLLGTFLVSREGAKLMQRRRYGRIVNIGSVGVPFQTEGSAIYSASKSAIMTFTQIMAREVAALGITCNVVAPGPIATDIIRSVPQEKIDAMVNQLAIKRMGTFEDVANVVDFFVKPESSYITGQVIYLGGA